MARHERFRERLAALELSRGARGADDAVTARAEAIDDAQIERQLGTDHGQVEALAIGERAELVNRARFDREDASISRDAGISGHTGHRNARRARERSYERVLASTGADDEERHADARWLENRALVPLAEQCL